MVQVDIWKQATTTLQTKVLGFWATTLLFPKATSLLILSKNYLASWQMCQPAMSYDWIWTQTPKWCKCTCSSDVELTSQLMQYWMGPTISWKSNFSTGLRKQECSDSDGSLSVYTMFKRGAEDWLLSFYFPNALHAIDLKSRNNFNLMQ